MLDNQPPSEDFIRILIATDVHLGHKQKHPQRCNDSFQAFQQVMFNAKTLNIDFLLLGGDLFDQVNPSKQTLLRCLNILRDNVFGSKQVSIHLTQDNNPYQTNFSNSNINIAMPIFTIHGNHDYPSSDFGRISVCDLLHASNYLNYFGKHLTLDHIIIKPLIFNKKNSNTKIALYGLGYIKDASLNMLFLQKKVTFLQPQDNLQNYFCLLILHQNRYRKGQRAGAPYAQCLDIQRIPQWIDLIIWGHQHQSITTVQQFCGRKIYQPGSTIITSYIQAEALPKQCALLIVKKKQFVIEPKMLIKSYRPMFCLSYEVSQLISQYGNSFDLSAFLEHTLRTVISQSQKTSQKKCIVRIKIEYTGMDQLIRYKEIENKFADQLANRQKIIVFWKRRVDKPITKTDNQLFEAMKNKKSVRDSQKQMKDQIVELFNQQLIKQPFKIYSIHKIKEICEQSVQEQTQNDLLDEKMKRMHQKVTQPLQDKMGKFMSYVNMEMKRAFGGQLERIKTEMNGKGQERKDNKDEEYEKRTLNAHELTILVKSAQRQITKNLDEVSQASNKKQQQRQTMLKNMQPTQISPQKPQKSVQSTLQRPKSPITPQIINIDLDDDDDIIPSPKQLQITQQFSNIPQQLTFSRSPFLQKLLAPIPNSYPQSKNDPPSKSRSSILKRNTPLNQRSYRDSSNSEDCCERAQRQSYDEQSAINNFDEAEHHLKDKQRRKHKKPQTKKPQTKKSVQFHTDFF